MTVRTSFAAVALLSLGLAGCSGTPTDPDLLTVQATVRFVNVEGGCWALDASNGTRFEPIGLPEAFRVDGRKVVAQLRSADGMGSFCMVGELKHLVHIRDGG